MPLTLLDVVAENLLQGADAPAAEIPDLGARSSSSHPIPFGESMTGHSSTNLEPENWALAADTRELTTSILPFPFPSFAVSPVQTNTLPPSSAARCFASISSL